MGRQEKRRVRPLLLVSPMKKLACLVLLAVSLSGCGTLWSFDDDLVGGGHCSPALPLMTPMAMSGTRLDLVFLRSRPLLALDLPFSLAADAALLPFTLVQSGFALAVNLALTGGSSQDAEPIAASVDGARKEVR